MYKIAIVEDEDEAAELLERYLGAYSEKTGIECTTVRYRNPVVLLTNYPSDFDLIFMDIDMPQMNGMDASRKLRTQDSVVPIIFVTNLAQFAIKGYEVNALDFVVKPVSYFDFSMKMDKVCRYLKSIAGDELVLTTKKGYVRLNTNNITYIETQGHQLIYHTLEQDYMAYGSLKNLEKNPKMVNFARCNACYLVNLRFVRRIEGYTVDIRGESLEISRPKRKEFVNRLNQYWGAIT